jgi:hypothetical protein
VWMTRRSSVLAVVVPRSDPRACSRLVSVSFAPACNPCVRRCCRRRRSGAKGKSPQEQPGEGELAGILVVASERPLEGWLHPFLQCAKTVLSAPTCLPTSFSAVVEDPRQFRRVLTRLSKVRVNLSLFFLSVCLLILSSPTATEEALHRRRVEKNVVRL